MRFDIHVGHSLEDGKSGVAYYVEFQAATEAEARAWLARERFTFSGQGGWKRADDEGEGCEYAFIEWVKEEEDA